LIQHHYFHARHALGSACCLPHACTTLHDTIFLPFHTAKSCFALPVGCFLSHALPIFEKPPCYASSPVFCLNGFVLEFCFSGFVFFWRDPWEILVLCSLFSLILRGSGFFPFSRISRSGCSWFCLDSTLHHGCAAVTPTIGARQRRLCLTSCSPFPSPCITETSHLSFHPHTTQAQGQFLALLYCDRVGCLAEARGLPGELYQAHSRHVTQRPRTTSLSRTRFLYERFNKSRPI